MSILDQSERGVRVSVVVNGAPGVVDSAKRTSLAEAVRTALAPSPSWRGAVVVGGGLLALALTVRTVRSVRANKRRALASSARLAKYLSPSEHAGPLLLVSSRDAKR
jgi:hypothetical protein